MAASVPAALEGFPILELHHAETGVFRSEFRSGVHTITVTRAVRSSRALVTGSSESLQYEACPNESEQGAFSQVRHAEKRPKFHISM